MNKILDLKIHLTNLPYKEIKRIKSEEEKSYFLDMNKLIEENFKNPSELSDAQYWILNQMMVKKIEGFLSSKYDVVYLYLQNPSKERVKALKELVIDNSIKNVTVSALKL
jgi:hypothetical protein